MQQRMNDERVKVRQKQDLQSNIQIRKKTEESDVLTRDYNPLENITCKIGDNACAAKHVSVIQKAGLFHPMNESQKVQSLLRLQRLYGNRFVQRVIAQHVIQTKLTVGQPGDIYEKEADRVADAVMGMPEPDTTKGTSVSRQVQGTQIQRVYPVCKEKLHRQRMEDEEEMQMQPLDEEEFQAKEVPGQTAEVTSNLEARINAMQGGGRSLPESERAFFEPRFGADFGQVRVHTDSRAAELAKAVNARAFTVGQDVVFTAGQYAPETTEGKRLLAHELTHVVQQGAIKTSVQRAWTPDTGWRYTPPATVTRSIVEIQGVVSTTPDGIYGPNTREAVKKYQEELRDNGLYTGDIDGKWGSLTEAAHVAFAMSGVSATAPRRGYNCAGFAFKTFTWHNLAPTRAILSTMTGLHDCSDTCSPRDYKFWLWECDISVTAPDGSTTPTHGDFHIVGGQTGRNGEGPNQVMSKNGQRPVEGPKPPRDWMPASGPAIDQDGNPVPGYTWNISNIDEECYCNDDLP